MVKNVFLQAVTTTTAKCRSLGIAGRLIISSSVANNFLLNFTWNEICMESGKNWTLFITTWPEIDKMTDDGTDEQTYFS